MKEIEAFAALQDPPISPSTVIQRAECGSGSVWPRWQRGGGCTLETSIKLRRYMKEQLEAAAAKRAAA